ncbi:MAG: tetratricopeptide repeat protein [bacterium]|nr:tetratricopeptide repeat protein [bacterium]
MTESEVSQNSDTAIESPEEKGKVKNKEEKVTLFRDLLNRRVPQIMGIYLGASASIVQFTEWLINRYMFSPGLVDLVLVILASLIPSILVMAYCHGMPGRNQWLKIEKAVIPTNFILTIVLIFLIFSGRDLGSVSKKVVVQDESGQEIQRVVPKSNFRKKIALFYFDNASGDKELDWLQYGVLNMMGPDLEQDAFLDMISPDVRAPEALDFYVYEEILKAGYKNAVGVPMALKRKIALQFHRDYFFCGKIKKEKEDFLLETTLYKSKNGKVIAGRTFQGKNIFELVDQLTLRLRKDLDIPAHYIEESTDLPVEELFTASLKAAQLYTGGSTKIVIDRDWPGAQRYLEQAVAEDPSFAQAFLSLVLTYTLNNQMEKTTGMQKKVMALIDKFPERTQFAVKINLEDNPDTQLAALKMYEKLYPDDVAVYALKIVLMKRRGRPDEVIAAYKRLLELDPLRYEIYRKMGMVFQEKGDYQQALIYYKKYAAFYPRELAAFTTIGGLYKDSGDFARAKEYYENALLLDPGHIATHIDLAELQTKTGDFDKAHNQYLNALTLCKTDAKKSLVYSALQRFYELTGRIKDAADANDKNIAALAKTMPPLAILGYKMASQYYHVLQGRKDEALRQLALITKQFTPPMDKMSGIGYIPVYLLMDLPDKAAEKLDQLESFMALTEMKQLQRVVFLFRGQILQKKGLYKDAISSFSEGLALKPDSTGILRPMARCYFKLKQFKKACEIYKKIFALVPFHPRVNYEAALLYFEMDDKEKGLEHLKIALKGYKDADPDYKFAVLAKEKMAEFRD